MVQTNANKPICFMTILLDIGKVESVAQGSG
jgi:hypothetical protein